MSDKIDLDAYNALTVHHTNGGSDKRALGAAELRDALTDLFDIKLDGLHGLDDALARLTNGVA